MTVCRDDCHGNREQCYCILRSRRRLHRGRLQKVSKRLILIQLHAIILVTVVRMVQHFLICCQHVARNFFRWIKLIKTVSSWLQCFSLILRRCIRAMLQCQKSAVSNSVDIFTKSQETSRLFESAFHVFLCVYFALYTCIYELNSVQWFGSMNCCRRRKRKESLATTVVRSCSSTTDTPYSDDVSSV